MKAIGESVIVVTCCYGDRFWPAVPAWLARIRSTTNLPVEIVSLDGGSCDEPGATTIHMLPNRTLSWGSGDRERTTHIVKRLEEGRTCIQIDLDVYLKRDIWPLIELPFDFIISRAFVFPEHVAAQLGFVACTGFYVAKPAGLPMLRDLSLRLDREGPLDQAQLNAELTKVDWHEERIDVAAFQGIAHVCVSRGVHICVLPKECIQRNDDLESSWFGNHFGTLLGQAK